MRKIQLTFLILLVSTIGLTASPTLAQTPTRAPRVTVGKLSFAYDPQLGTKLKSFEIPADPTNVSQPLPPQTAHTEILLYSGTTVPDPFDAAAVIDIYPVANFTGNADYEDHLARFQKLMKAHATINASAGSPDDALPFLPFEETEQVLHARVRYVDTFTVAGYSFITAFKADVSPFLSTDLLYTFQGLSADGNLYISVVAPLKTKLFPAELPANFDNNAFEKGFQTYLADTLKQLSKTTDKDFSPSLVILDGLVSTLTLSK